MLKVNSTSDVPLDQLRAAMDILEQDIEIEVNESQTFLLSAEPPSWIERFAQTDWWIKAFGAWAALYVAEVAKEAAAASFKATVQQAKKLYKAVTTARKSTKQATYVSLGFPFPDESYTALLRSEAETEE